MNDADLMSGKTRDEEWFIDDQTQWFEEQKRDEEELQQLREAALRDEIKDEMRDEIEDEVIAAFTDKFLPAYRTATIRVANMAYRTGCLHGFLAALTGAAVFFYFG